MREQVRRFPLAVPVPLGEWLRTLWRGCLRDDGSRYWTRREWLAWWWKASMRKWLCAPLRCKRGVHRIGPDSDTGFGGCAADGCMDVWCLDCDRTVRVPIDDLGDHPWAPTVLDIARETGVNRGSRRGL